MAVTIPLQSLTTYMFADPAGSRSRGGRKARLARQAIVVCGSDHISRIFALFHWAGRIPAPQFADLIINTALAWRVRVCGIEANAMQSLYQEMVSDRALSREDLERRVPIIPVNVPTNIDKIFRIQTIIQPVLGSGRLFLSGLKQFEDTYSPSYDELYKELQSFPTGATMDIVDALASCIKLIPLRPTHVQQSEDLSARLSYLRETGAPFSYIEKVARGEL